ncbi:hypothetical protein [Fictibacillus sp. 18YEL24]|uniref:hypothetical protein n=1 Tax=Fictibacillus sp. 18YEL24 TaxID=2745875 RepID=UPI0018CD51BF|nr:hypothetical protein [Fictibacillus sp. 18YEL24]MBH0169295.1 hypothetical protein [Fictibacillus sp. 18YEL24]
MEKNNNVINIKTVARPIKFRDQSEIIADRRKKRKERYIELKKQIRNFKEKN